MRLRDARHPVELLYYRGSLGTEQKRDALLWSARASRRATELERAERLARELVNRKFTVVSG